MENKNIVIYDIPLFSYLELVIKNDCFEFYSEIRINDDGDTSDVTYFLNKEETARLLSIISLDDFIEMVRKGRLEGMFDFFEKHNIRSKAA